MILFVEICSARMFYILLRKISQSENWTNTLRQHMQPTDK